MIKSTPEAFCWPKIRFDKIDNKAKRKVTRQFQKELMKIMDVIIIFNEDINLQISTAY